MIAGLFKTLVKGVVLRIIYAVATFEQMVALPSNLKFTLLFFPLIIFKMKYSFTLLFFLVSVGCLAQNIFSSPYSIYGLGIINNRLSTLNRGMGGTGIAVRDGYNLSYANPASYGSISSPISSVFEIGFYVEANNFQTNELSESSSNGSLSNINYWFKLSPKWSSIVGLSPFSSVSYKINTTRTLGGVSDINYTYEGSGNISQVYWGHSYNIFKNLSLGFNVSYLFGTITKSESISTFNQASALLFENKINTNKINVDAGLQYSIELNKNKSLVVGFVADDGIRFRATQKNYLYDGSMDTLNASTDKKISYAIPSSLGMGLALHTSRAVIAADLKFDKWSDVDESEEDVSFNDTWKFSMGYMYKGNPNGLNYLSAVSLRAGFHVQNYYAQIKGSDLPWWGISAGISIPVFDNRSSININYAFNQLGTLNDELILQHSQQVMVDVVVRDLWGVRRKFD